MKQVLWNRWIVILLRVSLGAVFIFSAWPKIADPPGFAHAIWNYRILPSPAVNLLAMVLPWLELWAGLALILGLLRKGAALIVAVLLLVFVAALTINVVRGVPVDCGCFSLVPAGKSLEDQMKAMELDILRDIAFLLMALHVFFAPPKWPSPCPRAK